MLAHLSLYAPAHKSNWRSLSGYCTMWAMVCTLYPRISSASVSCITAILPGSPVTTTSSEASAGGGDAPAYPSVPATEAAEEAVMAGIASASASTVSVRHALMC